MSRQGWDGVDTWNGITMQQLPLTFYQRSDVVAIARDLLGKIIVTEFDGAVTTARITETEAYNGIIDKASHAHAGRRTARTEIMYNAGGVAYVYLCYGIHHLFNVVTNVAEIPEAVLIRRIKPLEGIDTMLKRLNKRTLDKTVGKGPGTVSKALGITTQLTGHSLISEDLFIASDGFVIDSSEITAGPRIGVGYAFEDAFLPYRFIYTRRIESSGI